MVEARPDRAALPCAALAMILIAGGARAQDTDVQPSPNVVATYGGSIQTTRFDPVQQRTVAINVLTTDLVPTFSEIAGVTLPTDRQLDGRSFAPQLRGERGSPRDYAFMQLARDWWVRRDGWKLNQESELFDMSRAPFEETLIATDADSEASKAARTNLASALAKLNPAGGILDDGDGTGRHASKSKKGKKESDGSKRMP